MTRGKGLSKLYEMDGVRLFLPRRFILRRRSWSLRPRTTASDPTFPASRSIQASDTPRDAL